MFPAHWRSAVRQVAFVGSKGNISASHTERMNQLINSAEGKRMIAARFTTVEPVFGNQWHKKRLSRFTLRGRETWMGNGSCTV